MGLFKKAATGGILTRIFNQRQRRAYGYRRGRAYRRRAAQGGVLNTPIGRISLGGLAFLAARRYLGRQRHA